MLPRQLHDPILSTRQFFRNALYQPDQLRQRVFFALHKLDVISTNTITRPSQFAPYLNLIVAGRLRELPGPARRTSRSTRPWARSSTWRTNTKNNPNENYAREIMQLFSIGTVLLNQDGTIQN